MIKYFFSRKIILRRVWLTTVCLIHRFLLEMTFHFINIQTNFSLPSITLGLDYIKADLNIFGLTILFSDLQTQLILLTDMFVGGVTLFFLMNNTVLLRFTVVLSSCRRSNSNYGWLTSFWSRGEGLLMRLMSWNMSEECKLSSTLATKYNREQKNSLTKVKLKQKIIMKKCLLNIIVQPTQKNSTRKFISFK